MKLQDVIALLDRHGETTAADELRHGNLSLPWENLDRTYRVPIGELQYSGNPIVPDGYQDAPRPPATDGTPRSDITHLDQVAFPSTGWVGLEPT